jgi:hypothetical protein
LKVGLNSNTGGWLGAYSSEKVQFDGPIEKWSGPVVNFVKQAAFKGGFYINVTSPPDFLRNKSNEFFDSESSFDFCVYATALGYLDFCVAQYTVTNKRASVTPFLLLDSSAMHVIVKPEVLERIQSYQDFTDSYNLTLAPFTKETWIFMTCFVIPLFALLMAYHEYGKRGSSFPTTEKAIVTNEDGSHEIKYVRIGLGRTLIKAIYTTNLAVMQNAYEQPVVTGGAMLHLLGVSFFVFTITAAYTANLAAVLSTKHQRTVSGLDDAIKSEYRFCCERKNMESILILYQQLDKKMFVVDPTELGGDNRAGFNCENCSSRTRVFEMLDPSKAQSDPRYCHAALAPREDLEGLQALSAHCDLKILDTPLQYTQTGIPIFEKVSPQLLSLFLRLRNDGVMDEEVIRSRPAPNCVVDLDGTGSALSMTQLTGIWVISFAFAIFGLLAKFFYPFWR